MIHAEKLHTILMIINGMAVACRQYDRLAAVPHKIRYAAKRARSHLGSPKPMRQAAYRNRRVSSSAYCIGTAYPLRIRAVQYYFGRVSGVRIELRFKTLRIAYCVSAMLRMGLITPAAQTRMDKQ